MKQLFRGEEPPDPNHPRSETIPIRFFDTEVGWDIGTRMVGLVNRHIEVSEEIGEYINSSVQEAAQNIVDHANSRFGGVITGRCLVNRRRLNYAMVDCGDGIHDTLSPHHSDLKTPKDSMGAVIEGGFTAQSREHNRGLGISNLCLWIARLGGVVHILSDLVLATVEDPKAPRLTELQTPFPGTGVFIEMPIDH